MERVASRRGLLRGMMIAALLLLMGRAVAAPFSLGDKPVPGLVRQMGYFPGSDQLPLAYVAYMPDKAGPFPTIVWFDVYGAGSMPPTLPFQPCRPAEEK